MALKFYFYGTSKNSWLLINTINRRYQRYKLKKVSIDNMIIEPIGSEGIFKITLEGKGNNLNAIYDKSLLWLSKFLNFLTLFCKHGFKELDLHFCSRIDDNIEEKLKKFENSLQESAYMERKSTFPRRSGNVANYIKNAYLNTRKFLEAEKIDLNRCAKLENALTLFRLSYFETDERIRYILRFIALECIAKRRGNIKSLLNENKITISNNFTIEDLCKARNKIVHAGKEIMNSNNSPITHNYCVAIEKILRQLLRKLLSNLTSDLQTQNIK